MTNVKDGMRKRAYHPRSDGEKLESTPYNFRLSTRTPQSRAARKWLNNYLSELEGTETKSEKLGNLMVSVIAKQEGFVIDEPAPDPVAVAVSEIREELEAVKGEIESRADQLRHELRQMIRSMIKDGKTMETVTAAHDDFANTGEISEDVINNILEGFDLDL